MREVSLVTGANRGLGLEVVRQLARQGQTVYLAGRDPDAGERAAEPLISAGLDVRPIALDVTDAHAARAIADLIAAAHGRLDALVNNAAIHYDTWQSAADADLSTVREAIETNLLGAWQTTQALLPLLRNARPGRIVNVSSGAGSLTDMGGGIPAYRISKSGLNALTKMWAAELSTARIRVNAICPGWVATDMGGAGGRPVEQGAAGITWAATLPPDGPTGEFFRDQHPIPW